MITSTPLSARNFEHMVGTVRTDSRGLSYRVTRIQFKGSSRFTPATVSVIGEVIESKPGILGNGSTTLGAHASEIFTKNP